MGTTTVISPWLRLRTTTSGTRRGIFWRKSLLLREKVDVGMGGLRAEVCVYIVGVRSYEIKSFVCWIWLKIINPFRE